VAVNDARYSRQIRFAGVGEAGQQAIGRATVLIVGIGALGTHAADALARAGVGTLWLCDRDIVEWSNLQRQVLFDEADARRGTPKASAAAARLAGVNSAIAVVPFVADCTAAFLDGLPRPPDLVLDGTDNFPTRYLLNDWCRKHGVPWIYAGAVGGEGASMAILPGGPCLRCLWPEPPPVHDQATCETAGVLAPAIAAVTAFQTAAALQLLVGGPTRVTRGIFTCDVWNGSYAVLGGAGASAADCVVCRGERWPALEQGPPAAVTLCGRDAVQIDLPRRGALDLAALAERLRPAVQDVESTPHYLRFVADGCRFSVFATGRALLFGVQDPLRARALYDRWIGAS
jgi:adenylyltransferase/sulfurtransferase